MGVHHAGQHQLLQEAVPLHPGGDWQISEPLPQPTSSSHVSNKWTVTSDHRPLTGNQWTVTDYKVIKWTVTIDK